MDITPFLFAGFIGFAHAFELDHLVAVSTMVTQRRNTWSAIKEGMYWGIGHTVTILSVGAVILVGRVAFAETDFRFFEAAVGGMLVALGVYRLKQLDQTKEELQGHAHTPKPMQNMAFGVGLVHGIAGSGALLVGVMTTVQSTWAGLIYLIIFGAGSVIGMMTAAGVLSIPFSNRIGKAASYKRMLTILSSILSIGLGIWVFFENIN